MCVSDVLADQQRAWLLCQMEIDTHFLRQLNVLDYSLLLAHQPLHQDERPRGSFGSLIIRAKRYARRPRRGSPPTRGQGLTP